MRSPYRGRPGDRAGPASPGGPRPGAARPRSSRPSCALRPAAPARPGLPGGSRPRRHWPCRGIGDVRASGRSGHAPACRARRRVDHWRRGPARSATRSVRTRSRRGEGRGAGRLDRPRRSRRRGSCHPASFLGARRRDRRFRARRRRPAAGQPRSRRSLLGGPRTSAGPYHRTDCPLGWGGSRPSRGVQWPSNSSSN